MKRENELIRQDWRSGVLARTANHVHYVLYRGHCFHSDIRNALIIYALDVGHLVSGEPVGEYERMAPFKEKARVTTDDGQYLVELPRKTYDFYHLNEAYCTIMVSEIKPKTIEILL